MVVEPEGSAEAVVMDPADIPTIGQEEGWLQPSSVETCGPDPSVSHRKTPLIDPPFRKVFLSRLALGESGTSECVLGLETFS